ncbi:MAG: glycosyltransferase family 4 protein [Dysgonamonadaceae bacterium]|jgi:glycosyltransferase involved in cell wall biosynthesis|nr:glycosyltransferase family 4 protein [Dysgonamonadaceae bacterium]
MKRILFMGPLTPPYTGQSVAFNAVVGHFGNEKSKVIDISGKNTLLSGLVLCLKIVSTLLLNRFDLIYFTCSRSFAGSVRDVVMLFCARIRKVPVVNHLHGGDFKNFYEDIPLWYRRMIHWCYCGVRESIVLTEAMKGEFIDFPGMKLTVIPNSYSSDLDSCPTQKERNPDKPIEVLYLSNIMKMKGILLLMEAVDVTFSKYDNFKLSIAGIPIGDRYCSESEISRLFFEQYERLSLLYPGRIRYLGAVSGENKIQLLWDSDVFVLPTFYPTEAFPISILEALRTGNYILTTDHRFIPSIVSNDNGRLVKPDSTVDLSQALSDIMEHPELLRKIANDNIRFAMNHFPENKYLQSLETILLE